MQYYLVLAPLLTALTTAQTVLQYGSGQLPSCAQNCQALTTANQACIPPAAPVSSQTTYNGCFCQSNFLANNLAVGSSSAVSNVCNGVCTSASDQAAIQNWYDTLCGKGTTTAGAATTTTGVSAATTSASTSSTTGTDAANRTAESSGQRWWHEHARWIAMAIVLIFAFIIAGIIGMWLKRRNTRKHQREAAMAPPVVWGPHQNQHHSGGVAYGADPNSNHREKGKQRAGTGGVLPTASSQPVDYSEKDGTKKLKKFFKR